MMKQLYYFNSQEAAKVLGVNVSSIKRWTDEGKLHCVKSAGGHRKFLLHHLSAFLDKNKKLASKATLFPVDTVSDLQVSQHILRGKFDYLHTYVLDLAFAFERHRILQVLQGLYMAQFSLGTIYDRLIAPVLRDIGHMWKNGQVSIIEEHIATQNIRDSLIRLQAVISIPQTDKGIAACLCFPDELHDIGLKMADHLLESLGYKVLFSGALTPSTDRDGLVKSFRPDKLFLSSTIVKDAAATQQDFDHIVSVCRSMNIELYLGGLGFKQLKLDETLQSKLFTDFNTLELALKNMEMNE